MTSIKPTDVYLRQQEILKSAQKIQSEAGGMQIKSNQPLSLSQPEAPLQKKSFSNMVFHTLEQVNAQSRAAENQAKNMLLGDDNISPDTVAMDVKEAAFQVELTGKTLQELSDSLNKILNMNF